MLDILIEDYHVIEMQDISGYYQGSIINNIKDFNPSIFSEKELETLNFLLDKFKDSTSKELFDLTHKEVAYKQTKHNECISYDFAKDIKI